MEGLRGLNGREGRVYTRACSTYTVPSDVGVSVGGGGAGWREKRTVLRE